jgi:hypothetical protein
MKCTTVPQSVPFLLVCALAGACVDSSASGDDGNGGFPPPSEPATIDVLPAHWDTVPGKSKSFQATDPVSNAPLIWTAPPELSVIALESHSITLGSGQPEGLFELLVQSSVDPEVVGKATIQVVPFGFTGTLGGLAGNASHVPYADVAVSRGTGPGAQAQGSVFLALYDEASASNLVHVFAHDFGTPIATVSDCHFNPAQRPRIAADAQGRAFWVEQYYDASAAERSRALKRLNADGSLETFDWTPDATGGLQLVVGTDLACADDGTLYFLAEDGLANHVVRFADPFAAGTQPQVLAPIAAAGSQVQLAVDAQGRLLVALDGQLERWTILPAGEVEVEPLTDLGAAPSDLDTDADGTLYVLFDTELDVLDAQGQVVATLQAAEVGMAAGVPFEHLQGLGIDGAGNLRIADDPLADDAGLGQSSLRTFALDVQQL